MAASKSAHAALNANAAAANSVAERRLRPIYDWIDNGNNKKALQEADKVLKKQPNFQCCKVLKSLALLRMGNEDKALPLLDSVLNEGPTDDGTLQAMSMAFRELQQPEKICSMYENATKKEPQNEEFLSQLFMSYVRMGYYKKQQQAAMALYKARPKNPYYFWAVMSIVLQALTGDDKMAQTVTLPLAERMVAKMEKEKKMEQEQETLLYLMVLELQHKFKEALAVLDGPLGVKLEDQTSYVNLPLNKKIEYTKKLEQWDNVNVLTKSYIQNFPDQWNLYLDYITSVFRLIDGSPSSAKVFEMPNVDGPDTTIEAAQAFLTKMQTENPKCRGPFLAGMEFVARRIARQELQVTEGGMMDKVLNFYERFGHKPSCPIDMRLFLSSLDKSEYDVFLQKAFEFIQMDENNVPKSIDDIWRHCCWFTMQRFLSLHHSMTVEQSCALVEQLERHYDNCLPLVKDYHTTEQRPCDSYMVLASHVLWEIWEETEDDRYFWKAVVLLHSALKLSPSNFHIRFMLIRFYNQVGAVGVSQTIHTPLELKHVQLDSLGYLLTRHIQTCGHFNAAAHVFGNTLKFFTGNYKDIVDHIIHAYRYGSFEKIREFIKLRDRLSASQHYTTLTVERMLLDLLDEMSSHDQTVQMMSCLEIDPDKDEVVWSDLTDNRDFKAMVSWEPVEKAVSDELISESFIQDQRFLRIRSLMLRCLAAAVYMSEDIHPARKENGDDVDKTVRLSGVIKSLADKLGEQATTELRPWSRNPVQGPQRSRLHIYLRDGHPDLFLCLVRLVLAVQNAEDVEALLVEVAAKSEAVVAAQAKRMKEERQSMIRGEEQLEAIINIAESLSFAGILCGVCSSLMKPMTAAKKNKKKKELHPDTAKFSSHFNAMLVRLESCLQSLLSVIDDFEKTVELDQLEVTLAQHKFSELHLSPAAEEQNALTRQARNACQEDIAQQMASSYQVSFFQVRTVVQNKINYFKFLKL